MAFSLFVGLFAYIYSQMSFVEEYYSEINLAFVKKQVSPQENNEDEAEMQVFRPYMEKDVERYRFLLKSDLMIEMIGLGLGGKYRAKDIENAISVEASDAAGVIQVRFVSKNKDLCKELTETLPVVYNRYIENLDPSLAVEKVKSTKEAVLLKESQAKKNSAMGFLISLALAISFVAVLSLVRESIVWAEDIWEKGSLPLLGEFDGRETAGGVALNFEKHAEILKSKNILIVSNGPSDEKQAFALKIAQILAKKGRKVLLLYVNKNEENVRFYSRDGSFSLEEYFKNTDVSLKSVIRKFDNEELYYSRISNEEDFPYNLFNNERFAGLYFKLSKYLDYIFIVPEGKLNTDEAEALSNISDAALMMVRQGLRVKEIKDLKNQLDMFGIKLLGATFIKIK